jgi:Protein of unknown function (DUF3761)
MSSAVAIASRAKVPALVGVAGPAAETRFLEFFAANISNAHTRRAGDAGVFGLCSACFRGTPRRANGFLEGDQQCWRWSDRRAPTAYACNDNHYINSSGDVVHSPSCGREHFHQTAICRDDSVSFSEHHSGTCSHHHGVAQWE